MEPYLSSLNQYFTDNYFLQDEDQNEFSIFIEALGEKLIDSRFTLMF